MRQCHFQLPTNRDARVPSTRQDDVLTSASATCTDEGWEAPVLRTSWRFTSVAPRNTKFSQGKRTSISYRCSANFMTLDQCLGCVRCHAGLKMLLSSNKFFINYMIIKMQLIRKQHRASHVTVIWMICSFARLHVFINLTHSPAKGGGVPPPWWFSATAQNAL